MANTFRKVYKKTGSTGSSSDYQLVGNVGVNGVKLDIMKGATNSSAGEIGLVPKPDMGDTKLFLKSSGIWDYIFPVGSVYFNDRNTNPSEYFGGTWERISKGQFIVGVDEDDDDFASYGLTGGEKEVTLTVNEMPVHGHVWQPKNMSIYFQSGTGHARVYSGAAGDMEQIWTSNVGGNAPHNNLPPYCPLYIWRRTA